MKRVEKKLANHADCSNHVWMQYAEVRILAGFGKGMLKCYSWSHYARVPLINPERMVAQKQDKIMDGLFS